VLDQFLSKTTATIDDIKDIIHDAVKNPCEPQDKDKLPGDKLRPGWEPWRERLRFEAQSVASAASTLGAAMLSMNALEVETKILEDESAIEINIAVDVMAASFVAIKKAIESMTGQVRHGRFGCRSNYGCQHDLDLANLRLESRRPLPEGRDIAAVCGCLHDLVLFFPHRNDPSCLRIPRHLRTVESGTWS
jgi:hypothetical protein